MTTGYGRDELARRLRLIVITDAALAAPRPVEDVVRRALAAGAPAVQLRDKNASARDLYASGERLLAMTRAAGALLFVNDRADVALALGADGVHVGPGDVPVAALRRVVPERFLIGTSTDEVDTARRLVAEGADYVGCGTVYATTTKGDAGEVIGPEGLERVALAVDAPVIGIGGIDARRAPEIASTTHASGVAVVGAVMRAQDVEATVRALLAPWAGRSG